MPLTNINKLFRNTILGLFLGWTIHTPATAQDVLQSDSKNSRVAMMSPQFRPVIVSGEFVYLANTPNNTIDVLDKKSNRIEHQIAVGIEPVGLAIRPDGKELWVANHVSDSVSIIDIQVDSPSRFVVLDTIQDFDPKTKATRFDEPVGVVFADNHKAYVSLSSENQIAVIDVHSREIIKRLRIPAQDPRGIVVRNGRLYVIPFESNNQTQLSGGKKQDIDGDLVTFDAWEHSIHNNNVLSIGHVVDIIKNPKVPDRDLLVFDVANDQLIETVSGLGTLLYGITADSQGTVYVAQTDARNDVNGRAGTKKHGLAQLDNRPFLNRVTRIENAGLKDGYKPKVSWFDLEPLPPNHPAYETAQATPFAVELSIDDRWLYLTAAGSDAFRFLMPNPAVLWDDAKSGPYPKESASNTVMQNRFLLGFSTLQPIRYRRSISKTRPNRRLCIRYNSMILPIWELKKVASLFQPHEHRPQERFPVPVVTPMVIPTNCSGS